VIADYGVNTLGKKKWAVLHSTDAFGTAGGKALTDALQKLDAPPVLDQGYANQSQDFTPVALAIKQSGADILGSYFTFEQDLGIFARQLRQLGVTIPWVGSPSIVNITALMANYAFTAVMLTAFDQQLHEGRKPLLPLP